MPKPIKGKSDALNWLRSHVLHDGDECLIWPYSTTRGYAQVFIDGKLKKATRVMCEWVNGAAPPKHEAAHDCGNRACVNPRHLSWKTRSENQMDAVRHGTVFREGNRWNTKLTPAQALEIRSLKGSLSQDKIASRFGVSHSTVAKIHRGEMWRQ